MDNTSRVRMELDINAQRIVSQIQINNESIADQLKAGIELGIQEIADESDFVRAIADATKKEVGKILKESILSWDMRDKIQRLFTDKIKERVDSYAEEFAKKIIEGLNT